MDANKLAETVGANIAAERKARGLQQGWLADRMGVRQSQVSMVEQGHRMPPLEFLFKAAELMGCPLVALLKGADSDTDAYRQGYADGWRDCADDVSGHLTWKPRGGAS